jgi:hypothetical protein
MYAVLYNQVEVARELLQHELTMEVSQDTFLPQQRQSPFKCGVSEDSSLQDTLH